MRASWLAGAAVASLFLHLRAAYFGPVWQVYLFKPITTTLLIVLALTAAGGARGRYRTGILVGLGFSLVGDVLLMLPQNLFVAGLGAFLLAHLAYLVAFTDGVGWRLAGWPRALYLAAAGGVLVFLWDGLGDMRIPVITYMLVIVTMASQAAGRALTLGTPRAEAAARGAALFVVSDATIAVDRFGEPFGLATAVIMVTYIAAQLLIASSAGSGQGGQLPAPA